MGPDTIFERRPRHAVRLTAMVRRADGCEQRAQVSDLSLDGCCLAAELPIGERLRIKLVRIGAFRGQVRWSIGGHSGVRFISAD